MNVISWFDRFYSRLPNLSGELRVFIIKILPYVSLVGGLLITFASITEIIGTPFLSIFSLNTGATIFQSLLIVSVVGIIQGVLMIAAFRPLRRNLRSGWKLVFWSQILWCISALMRLSPSFILGLLLLYPLFQVKEHYR